MVYINCVGQCLSHLINCVTKWQNNIELSLENSCILWIKALSQSKDILLWTVSIRGLLVPKIWNMILHSFSCGRYRHVVSRDIGSSHFFNLYCSVFKYKDVLSKIILVSYFFCSSNSNFLSHRGLEITTVVCVACGSSRIPCAAPFSRRNSGPIRRKSTSFIYNNLLKMSYLRIFTAHHWYWY